MEDAITLYGVAEIMLQMEPRDGEVVLGPSKKNITLPTGAPKGLEHAMKNRVSFSATRVPGGLVMVVLQLKGGCRATVLPDAMAVIVPTSAVDSAAARGSHVLPVLSTVAAPTTHAPLTRDAPWEHPVHRPVEAAHPVQYGLSAAQQ